jgi:23S rRNA pseudouridine2605 synthase
VVYALNKPKGYISTMDDEFMRKKIPDLITDKIKENVFHVGRLDKDTSGLILLTNNGTFANFLTHPSSKIEKTYVAKIKGSITDEEVQKIEKGMELEDGFVTSPSRIIVIKAERDTSTIKMMIYEGHKREIREIFKILNHHIFYLKRIAIGNLNLSVVPKPGNIKKLNKLEIKSISKRALDFF